jgi:hypothetical protein
VGTPVLPVRLETATMRPRLSKQRQGGVGAVDRAEVVDLDQPAEGLEGLEVAEVAPHGHAGVVDQDVEPAVQRFGAGDQGAALRFFGDIRHFSCGGRRAGGTAFGRHRVEALPVAGGQHQMGAGAGQQQGQLAADA